MEQVLNENCEMLKDMSDEDVCVITKAWLKGGLEYFGVDAWHTKNLDEQALMKNTAYRTKRNTIKIGDMEVPEPFKGTLEDGDRYFTVDLYETTLYDTHTWLDDYQDRLFTERQLIHLNKESAIVHAKALIKVSGGEV